MQEMNRTELFAPFGMENPKPAFLLRGVKLVSVTWFGKGEEHLRLTIAREDSFEDKPFEAIAFFARRDLSASLPSLKDSSHITILGNLERDMFTKGQPIRLRIIGLSA